MGYYCMLCESYYETPTSDFICQVHDCPGEGVTGILIEEKTFLIAEGRLGEGVLSSGLSVHQSNADSMVGIYPKELKIGRSAQNHIVITQPSVSSEHAIITMDRYNKIRIVDLTSTNGTYVNGHKVEETTLQLSDKVKVARFLVEWAQYFETGQNEGLKARKTIGREAECDIIISEKEVSRLHATIWLMTSGEVQIHDENSSNGVYVNDAKINGSRTIYPADRILIAKKYELKWIDIKREIKT